MGEPLREQKIDDISCMPRTGKKCDYCIGRLAILFFFFLPRAKVVLTSDVVGLRSESDRRDGQKSLDVVETCVGAGCAAAPNNGLQHNAVPEEW